MSKILNQNRYKDPRQHARVTTSVDVLMGQHVNLNINVSGALETTLLGPAKRGKDYELYSLGYSPICVNEVEESLKFYSYKVIANELIHGLRFGFKLQYSGSRLPVNANNSKSVTIHADLVREKINKEITLGRMAGPFDHPPLPTLRISPIFLAEKKDGDYRLIHNLSYPLHNSVNDFIDEKYCSVQYSGIDDAVRLVQNIGIAGKLSKSDVKSAFRLLRVSPSDFDQLGFIFDGKYYFDRCLPQGASISCSLFEKFSTALHWVTELTSGNSNILHYLDDFLFGGEANSPTCQETLETFKKICSDWGVPLAEDKTVQPTEILTFLGIEFDTLKMEMRLPGEKLTNLKQTLQLFLHSKKVTLRQLQSLIGLLNFACQVIAPGRAFCRRLIDATCNIRKPHHRVRVSCNMREDIKVWTSFLEQYNGVTVMIDSLWTSNDMLELFTDSAGGQNKGFGIYFQGKWAQSCWPKEWAEHDLLKDITYLELFPVVISLHIWGVHLKNKRILFYVDNQAVVTIINKRTSKSNRVMSLMRNLVFSTLKYNIVLKAEHIPGKINTIADSLSRCDFQRFRHLCPEADQYKTAIPDHLWTF